MKLLAFKYLNALFVVALCSCMLLGAVLTLAQMVGVLLSLPDIVIGAADHLMKPVMATAAAFALLSFFATYLRPGEAWRDAEADD